MHCDKITTYTLKEEKTPCKNSNRHFTTSDDLFLVVDAWSKLATRNLPNHSTKLMKISVFYSFIDIAIVMVEKLLNIDEHQSF